MLSSTGMQATTNLSMLFTVSKYLFFLTFFFGFIGPVIFLDLGPFAIYPFRAFFLLLLLSTSVLLLSKPEYIYLLYERFFKYGWFFVLWFVYAIVSLLWVESFKWAFAELANIFFFGTLIPLGLLYIETRKDLNVLVFLWILAFILSLGVGIWEILTGNHLITSKFRMENFQNYKLETFIAYVPKHRTPTAFFYNQNNFATFISLSLPLAIFMLRGRFLRIVVLSLSAVVLIFTLSRANYVAFALLILMLPFFLDRRQNAIYLPFLTLLILSAISLLIFVINTPVVSKDIGIQRIYYKFRAKVLDVFKGSRDISASIRRDIWISSLEYWERSNFMGTGAGQVEYFLEEKPPRPIIYFKNPHNWFVEMLSKYGILVFISYMIFWMWIFLNLWHNRRDKLAKALMLSLICFIPASVSPSSLIPFYPHWALYVLLLGFVRTS